MSGEKIVNAHRWVMGRFRSLAEAWRMLPPSMKWDIVWPAACVVAIASGVFIALFTSLGRMSCA